MLQENAIWMGVGAEPENKLVRLLLNQANRHGLIAGASGTGKTVTLKVLAEGFSHAGVPVFMADVKGDITGMGAPGKDSEDMQERIAKFGIEGFTFEGCPVRLWDMLGGAGIPVRITISDMGPSLLARMLGSPRCRRACSISSSALPMTSSCCSSTSKTCAPCSTM